MILAEDQSPPGIQEAELNSALWYEKQEDKSMALIQVNFLSEALMRTVPVQVILPVDKMGVPGSTVREEKPFKTLYLLHGIFGNYTDWVSGTNIQRWAEERSLAVVMPSGDNMFYVDQKEGHNFYGEYIGRELVEMTRRMFPLSRKREDTYIGGLSMGGYGALRNGLKYSGTFGCIASLSGAMLIDDIAERTDGHSIFHRFQNLCAECVRESGAGCGERQEPEMACEETEGGRKRHPEDLSDLRETGLSSWSEPRVS